MGHFSTHEKAGHYNDKPPLQDLADTIKRDQFDQNSDFVSVLGRYFGEAAVAIMHKHGWERGQGLGSPASASGPTAFVGHVLFNETTHPQMWSLLAGTLAVTSAGRKEQ